MIVGIVLVIVVLAVIGILLEANSPSLSALTVPLLPTGFAGELPIPESEIQPVLDRAQDKARERYKSAETLLLWKTILTYSSLAATVVVSLVAAFYGRKPDSFTSSDGVPASKLFRVLAVLVVLSGALTQITQQLEAQATKRVESATTLNALLVQATTTLYDEQTSLSKAKITVQQLEDATNRPW